MAHKSHTPNKSLYDGSSYVKIQLGIPFIVNNFNYLPNKSRAYWGFMDSLTVATGQFVGLVYQPEHIQYAALFRQYEIRGITVTLNGLVSSTGTGTIYASRITMGSMNGVDPNNFLADETLLNFQTVKSCPVNGSVCTQYFDSAKYRKSNQYDTDQQVTMPYPPTASTGCIVTMQTNNAIQLNTEVGNLFVTVYVRYSNRKV